GTQMYAATPWLTERHGYDPTFAFNKLRCGALSNPFLIMSLLILSNPLLRIFHLQSITLFLY
ncbi:hypothetical protein PTB13_13355, partial [Bacillus sp. MHSD17]|nr:hypothetical protein [Bacillus sp. MHSD17]